MMASVATADDVGAGDGRRRRRSMKQVCLMVIENLSHSLCHQLLVAIYPSLSHLMCPAACCIQLMMLPEFPASSSSPTILGVEADFLLLLRLHMKK
jgi:hypothetical protein